MEFDVLYKGEFVDLVSPKGIPYECLHEKDNVIILPVKDGKFGLRFEYVPPYMLKDSVGERNYYTVISGCKKDNNEDTKDTAVRELREESGVIVKSGKLYRLYDGIAYVKSTDMRSSLVFLNIKEYDTETPKGDGTAPEKKSKTIWVGKDELEEILKQPNIDALLFFCSFIIKQVMKW